MNNRTKIVAGTSGAGILLLIFHFWHLAHAVNELGKKDEMDGFKNAKVTIILTDSSGKKDTMPMKDYLEQKK